MEKKTPKVFISYSWAVQEWTINLANRLVEDGVETVLDLWDLKKGCDKYKFMESMVTDDTIDYVLILCDKTYTSKANNRTGGVGDETAIISSELYGKSSQTKFLPLVLHKNENGDPILPVYIKSRLYFDFSDENGYENEYEKLLRCIYDKPLVVKPKLGRMPEWLKENSVNLSILSNHISVMKSAANETRKKAAVIDFSQDFSKKTKEFIIDESKDVRNEIIKKIEEMKPLRDLYLDFLKEVILSEKDIVDFVCIFLETIYNDLMVLPPNTHSWSESHYEHFHFLIWETFICTITYLLHYEKYKEIYAILTHTYYLQKQMLPYKDTAPSSFLDFECSCETLNSYGTSQNAGPFSASIVVKRVKEPLITQETLTETDIFICQMSFALKNGKGPFSWFPMTYLYASSRPFAINIISIWKKLSSRQYCEKILPLFGVKSIDELKQLIQENPVETGYGYSSAFYKIPKIPLIINKYDIASLP